MELQTRLATPKAGLSGIKVSLISATFKYRRSYQENLWAESLADLGATVSIFAPIMKNSKTQTRDKPTPITQYSPLGSTYHLIEIPSHVLPKHQVLTDQLADQLVESTPDLIVWCGCIMFFGRAAYLDDRLSGIPLISMYSLTRKGRHSFKWFGSGLSLGERLKSFAFQTIRAPVLTQSIKRAQLTVASTPECTDIMRQYVWGQSRIEWARKHEEFPLGFLWTYILL